ncbi:MAG: nucleotidyltransferase family protein [Actinomycetota bacterium]|nr:nucleotidyltransferase family protein [Actinomycetota bacterium]
MEALILAGGKAERLGEAARGNPKPLVPVGGRPLLGYTVRRLALAGVTRAIIACSAGQEDRFAEGLSGLGVEILAVGEPEPLGRGGGLRFAAARREQAGAVLAMNGDELLDLDYRALVNRHGEQAAAATVVVAQVNSPFGVVELDDDDGIRGFREAPKLEHWVNAGVYVLGEEAIARLPEKGDHEQSTFPALAQEGRLRAYRHSGAWLTVNTPKDLRRAEEYLAANPDWHVGRT